MLAELRAVRARMSEFAGLLAGGLINNTLAVETATVPADGVITRQWHVAAGALEVSPLGDNPVTVVASGPSSSAPAGGTGVYVVAAGATRTIAVASRQVTLYGTAGDLVSFQAFTGAVRPASGGG
jgi:hypothetical protein